MTAAPRVPRSLDHLVLPVGDLSVARQRLQALGFTVAADARHPFGTENACVFFSDKTYLEPLAVGQREDCEAAAIEGNVFVARDQAYRFRRGQDGFSAIVVSSSDASADDARFRQAGLSGGAMLEFSRPMQLPDGTAATGRFRLAFASDLRAPDFFFFACERVQPLPADRSALETHANGVIGMSDVVLSEPNPTDFQYILQEVVDEREVTAHSFGMDIETANVKISVLNPAGMQGFFGRKTSGHARGLRGRAIVLKVADLSVTEHHLAAHAVEFIRKDNRLIVPEAPGQGVIFAFGE
ncbi:VOC family protein [Pararhizobium antarcticum]|uniref:Lactoylglutathione lyase n=1 Tax=Pararhizobium antarcticum TaxID=1798805 RepID=A0A657LQU9_9HYPH|nr:VOC family protein [Pararhizobium antarcticum]OJF91792.1 lactoylglutathione lyase [Rhizobium sp. 58]OJF93732.1 lactoylglutathione lyase [Pararhizobium antarcticum]